MATLGQAILPSKRVPASGQPRLSKQNYRNCLGSPRSLKDLLETIDLIQSRGVAFRSLGEGIDTTTPAGRLVFHVFASIAQFERGQIVKRTKEGFEAARKRGRVGGRPPALSHAQKAEVRRMRDEEHRSDPGDRRPVQGEHEDDQADNIKPRVGAGRTWRPPMRDIPRPAGPKSLGRRVGEDHRGLVHPALLDLGASGQAAPHLVVYWSTKEDIMGVHKQSVSFTEAAFAYARELVDRGDYPNVSAAVSGELARARAAREREQMLLEAEVRRRLQVPTDQWEPVTRAMDFTADARAFLAERKSEGPSQA